MWKRPCATEIFDWNEEYDTITNATDKVRVGTATADPQPNLKERQMQMVLQMVLYSCSTLRTRLSNTSE